MLCTFITKACCLCCSGRFVYRTPFTVSGKAHGNISDQYMRKTILTSEEHFPYVRTRIKVRESKEVSVYLPTCVVES